MSDDAYLDGIDISLGYTAPVTHWYTVATPGDIKDEMDKILREGETLDRDIGSFSTGDPSFPAFRDGWRSFWASYKKFSDSNASGAGGWLSRLWSATGEQVVAYGNQVNDWRMKFSKFPGAASAVTEPETVPVQHRPDPTSVNWEPWAIGGAVILGLFGGGYAVSKVVSAAALFKHKGK